MFNALKRAITKRTPWGMEGRASCKGEEAECCVSGKKRLQINFLDDPVKSPELHIHTSYEVIECRQFDTVYVALDNKQFLNCHFQGCILIYSGGPFAMIDCEIDGETFLELTGSAARGHVLWNNLRMRSPGSMNVASPEGD